ncbi:T9SS type A sorting domain-containing protein [bacterium]|nr:T9SS type A sorting domain-containing protein [bacterium]MBU1636908.1 T9SS type A sorting domain-containing protein [bacterium]MBU1920106.1 T9SS type A sorting domain-containing protein [bacterium]
MKRQWLWIIALSFGIVASAYSADVIVRGPVSGKWNAGSRVFVESAIWVEAGETLTIDEGVQIEFSTTDYFFVDGELSCNGTAAAPIVIRPCKDWMGFYFRNLMHSNDWDTLSYVVIEESVDVASGIVLAENSKLRIHNCDFISRDYSIEMLGGRIEAWDNSFLTCGSTSRVVTLQSLNLAVEPEHFSFLDRNLIQIDGTRSDTQAGPHDRSAMGLDVDVSGGLFLRENAIQLWLVPNTSIGVNLGRPGRRANNVLEECVVKVTTNSGYYAYGVHCVQPVLESNVQVIKSTIDIAVQDPSGLRIPVAVKANNDVMMTVNSTAIRCSGVGESSIPYIVGSALLEVEYSLRWYAQMSASMVSEASPEIPGHDLLTPAIDYRFGEAGGFNSPSDLPPGVTEIEVITDQDPGFAMEGEEGIWASHADVEDYYNLLENSPCREAGDPQIDENPNDNDLPDVGRYEYIGIPDDVPVSLLPANMLISAAFPNPFNPTTTVRIELIQSGHVRMVVYDILGREVGIALNRRLDSGYHTVGFDGNGLASGVYLLNIEYNGSFVETQKLVLMK